MGWREQRYQDFYNKRVNPHFPTPKGRKPKRARPRPGQPSRGNAVEVEGWGYTNAPKSKRGGSRKTRRA